MDHFYLNQAVAPRNADVAPIVAVVIPCYRVTEHIMGVLAGLGAEVQQIYVVDDACPEHSGRHVEAQCTDLRVRVLYHAQNQGVGGAVMTGYKAAIAGGAEIIVKVDGDGQMDATLIPLFIAPILAGGADYVKGNRFYDLDLIRGMPRSRIFGNAVLSLMTKLSTGYWDLFDPTNGFTAIHAAVAEWLPFTKISHRYFFETDILFRLNTLRAVVIEVPMGARYGAEVSNLKISRIIGEFLVKHIRNAVKRLFYNYYLRDVSLASIELPLGISLIVVGVLYGAYHWIQSAQVGVTTPAGTVMASALPILLGMQFVIAFLGYDIAAVPKRPLQGVLRLRRLRETDGI